MQTNQILRMGLAFHNPQSAIRNPHSNIPASILVVDDDEANCNLLESILATEGYTVRSAASGEAALPAVAQQLPDLILLDILLPGIDGFEVTRRLKADSRTNTIPIILVTMLEDRESRLTGLQAGANEFLSKPVDYTELLTRVKNQLKVKEYTDFLAEHNRILEKQVQLRTAALQASEEKFRAIFEEANDGIVLTDAESGLVANCNPEFERQCGRPLAQLKTLHVWELRPPELQEAARRKFEEIRTTGHGSAELGFQRPDGTFMPAELRVTRVRLGDRDYLISISRDITERKKAEAQIDEQLSELRRWYEATLGQGMRAIELKREVNELLRQAGQPPRYLSVEQGNAE